MPPGILRLEVIPMPLAKFRYIPAPEPENRAAPRLAGDEDTFVASPVHALQSGLAVLEQSQSELRADRYPGWFRLGFPLVSSVLLWGGILWSVGLIG
ncbi:hypothetical protein [Novosphingobium cyanobacteriorum]|uniref:Uncharacterized protein n=1 Tax=Novosphingobium cyanobacteriorum TaxID=3024215 RepID=A0ABT6CMW3_9SPHN|nr:hypothetical protein [Novosphingobium cyanobacteriorum]MDF8335256.1 hypothetical protein [Novosphingobium cyanobacteriorum]